MISYFLVTWRSISSDIGCAAASWLAAAVVAVEIGVGRKWLLLVV